MRQDFRLPSWQRRASLLIAVLGAAAHTCACGGSNDDGRSVVVVANAPNVVSYWNAVANRTVVATGAVNGTEAEQRPTYHVDLATLHVAIYDAVSAIDRRFVPFAVAPTTPVTGASLEAAASAAAYGVLRALYPNRSEQYQAAYASYVDAIPPGEAKARGLAIGAEVADRAVALRDRDGRGVALSPYVSSSEPGKFRSANATPFNRYVPFLKPFSMARVDQFRPRPPPSLDSPAYAEALNASKAAGGTTSSTRSAGQLEAARFHTEVPNVFVPRNLGRFAASTADVGEAARLMAFIYVTHADAITACFEAKYFFQTWRPLSAIPLAESDGNPATIADPAWTPALPTPNHPEYPAAHSCTAGALGETLRQYYGTRKVSYSFDSNATNTTRTYDSTEALNDESETARVYGGMHFGFATVAGVELGTRVAQWVGQRHFGRRP